MIAPAMILAFLGFALTLAWLAGLATRSTVSACNQHCRQVRDCSCASVETQP